jgi:hypothetical protein
MTHCPKARCLISFVALFAFLFLYDKLFNGSVWMVDMYQQTANLWRSPEDMHRVFPWMFARYALLAAAICCLYKKTAKAADAAYCAAPGEKKPCSPLAHGLCFGIALGMLMGTLQASSYLWMPIPGALVIAWFLGALVQGVLAGLLLSFLCRMKNAA